jgi:hypothetical protein
MCLDPLSLAAIGLSAGGTLLQSMGAQKAEKARAGVMANETARQAGYDREAQGVFKRALSSQERESQDTKLVNARANRERAGYDALSVDSAPGVTPIAGSAPGVVGETYARALNKALAQGRDEVKRRAALSSYGDLDFFNSADLARTGQQAGTIGSFARGSSGVVPLELEGANQKGSGLRSFGSLLSGLAQPVGLAGAFGAGSSMFRPSVSAGRGFNPRTGMFGGI